jgi:hypothetical protein
VIMKLFGKKKDMPPPPPPMGMRRNPISEVQLLSSRGLSEPEIIETLRREGYSTNEIDSAMKDALRSRISGGYQPAPQQMPPPRRDYMRPEEQYAPQPYTPQPAESFEGSEMPSGNDFEEPPEDDFDLPEEEPVQRRMPVVPSQRGMDKHELEELTEVLVEEKARELKKSMSGYDTRFQQMTNKISALEIEINSIKNERNQQLRDIEAKIDTYRETITELSGRTESMERALKDSLAPMLESLRSLSETIKAMKEKR